MQRIALSVLIVLGVFATARSQYVIPYPYLIPTFDSYSNPYFGNSFFTLPRPNETYQSTRLRSLASGFEGLISDPLTDQFRNPAYHVCEKSSELFGDFGSMNDLGKFFLGTFIHAEKEKKKGMIGVNVILDKMLKATTQYSSENFPSSSSYRTSSTSLSEMNPERYGGRLSYSWSVSEKTDLGVSYEFISKSDGTRSEYSYNTIPIRAGNSSQQITESSYKGKIHTASIGSVVMLENASVQYFARGVFSTNSLQYLYRRTEYNFYSQTKTDQRTPTDVDTKAGVLGVVYETKNDALVVTRLLFELALTSYSASEVQSSLYEYGDTIRITTSSLTSGNRTLDGKIWDIKAGIARQLPLTDELKGYAGLTVNFVTNTSDGSEVLTQSSMTTPSTPTTTTNRVLDFSMDGWDIKLPLGLEYSLSEHVSLSGGIEPRYRSGEAKGGQTSTFSSVNPSSSVYKTQDNRRGLQFSAQAGVSFWKDDIGVLSVLLGKNVADLSYWSVFMRYFL